MNHPSKQCFDSLFSKIYQNNNDDIAIKQPASDEIIAKLSVLERIGSMVFIAVPLPDYKNLKWVGNTCTITLNNTPYIINKDAYHLLKQFDGRCPLSAICVQFINSQSIVLRQDDSTLPEQTDDEKTASHISTALTWMLEYGLITYLHNSIDAATLKSPCIKFQLSDWKEAVLMKLFASFSFGPYYIHFTYRHMNQCIRWIADRINSIECNPDSIIAISVKDRLCFTMTVLASIYTGHAYTSILPNLPYHQKERIIKNNNCMILISDFELDFSFVSYINFSPSELRNVTAYPQMPLSQTSDEQTLYTCYTSGTTGDPKIIQVTKLGMHNYLAYRSNHYAVQRHHNTLHVLNENSDAFWGSLKPTLVGGGCAVFCELETKANYEKTCEIIERCRIHCFSATPKMLEAIIDVSKAEQLSMLEFIIIGGEAVSSGLFQKLTASNLSVQLINEYGATETTITCCADPDFTADAMDRIGRPISNTQIMIVDETMQQVHAMTNGEILIAGYSLAKGLNENDLYEFEGRRYYRTGDIGYYDQEHYYRYVKRKSNAIKINGIRLDLHDVESIIRGMNHTCDVKATIVNTENQEKVFVFVVSDEKIDTADILTRLHDQIYLYAIPVQIVHIERLPINGNGKVDTNQLAIMVASREETADAPIHQKLDVEEIVHSYWCKYLEVEKIDHDVLFFETGGN